jgi:hypothetical protein
MMLTGTGALRGAGTGATYGTYGANRIAVSPFRRCALSPTRRRALRPRFPQYRPDIRNHALNIDQLLVAV